MCYGDEITDIFKIIIGFYFGTQSEKKEGVSNVGNTKEIDNSK